VLVVGTEVPCPEVVGFVYTTDDVIGVEMAGALKNVYALAVGMGYSAGPGEIAARW
jgi:glycerol-3-phosphate dehydrogenase